MHRHAACLASVLLALAACSDSLTGSGKKDDADAPADGGDDDFSIGSATPMSLVGGDYLATLATRLGAEARVGADGAVSVPATPLVPTADDFAHARRLVDSGATATSEARRTLAFAGAYLEALFGANGYFRGQDVLQRKDGAPRVFALGPEAAPARLVVVRYVPPPVKAEHVIEVVGAAAEGPSSILTRIALEPYDSEGKVYARVRLASAHDEAGGRRRHLEIAYDTRVVDVSVAYGRVPVSATEPAKTSLQVRMDGGRYTTRGIYSWSREGVAPPSGLLPRYYDLRTGDVEAFVLRGSATAPFESAQKLVFNDAPYDALMEAFAVGLVRAPGANPSCGDTGDRLRGAFGSTPVPPLVASAPGDLCAGSAASDPVVRDALVAACDAGIDVTLALVLDTASGAPAPLRLCPHFQEASLLRNPQTFVVAGDARSLITSATDETAAHATLKSELDATPFLTASALEPLAWPPLASSAEASRPAEPRP